MTLPNWIEPQLCKLVDRAPAGERWIREIKFDGYRMAARVDRGAVRLLTRNGLDWMKSYPDTAAAFAALPLTTAYFDGELCALRPDGVSSFQMLQQGASNAALVYFAFDLIDRDGDDIASFPLLERKARLAAILKNPPTRIAYSEHERGNGEAFRRAACRHGLEGVVSKRIDRLAPSSGRSARCLGQNQTSLRACVSSTFWVERKVNVLFLQELSDGAQSGPVPERPQRG